MLKIRLFQQTGGHRVIHPKRPVINRYYQTAPPGGNLNILILGDGYTSNDRLRFYQDRTAILRRLYNTDPFDAAKRFIYVFSRFDESPYSQIPSYAPGNTFFQLYVPNPAGSSRVMVDDTAVQKLFEHVAQLEHAELGLLGGPTWLEPEQRGWLPPQNGVNPANKGNKSFGCICIIGRGVNNAKGGTYHPAKSPDQPPISDRSYPGGELAYFAVVQKDSTSIAESFLHELAHALGLADEYETPLERDSGGKCMKEYYPGAAPDPNASPSTTYSTYTIEPNIVRRWELLDNSQKRASDDAKVPLSPADLPQVAPLDFRWRNIMQSDEVNNFRDLLDIHPNWQDQVECRARSNSPSAKKTNKIALIEGASHHRRNIFRSAPDCIMRDPSSYYSFNFSAKAQQRTVWHRRNFCKVCRIWLWRLIQS